MELASLTRTLERIVPVAYAQEVTSSLTIQQVLPTPEYIKERIKYYADLYQVSEEVMNKVVDCESGYLPNALGDAGRSRGLVQINEPSHPNVSIDQAFDIEFSLDFLARNLSEDKGAMWTCWRKYYAN